MVSMDDIPMRRFLLFNIFIISGRIISTVLLESHVDIRNGQITTTIEQKIDIRNPYF
jgi:hypothetical protein